LGVEKVITSKLYESGVNRRLFIVDKHVGMIVAGLIADARQLVIRAREEAVNYKDQYGTPVPLSVSSLVKHTLFRN
jgi:20S proteasome subunit alpha 7